MPYVDDDLESISDKNGEAEDRPPTFADLTPAHTVTPDETVVPNDLIGTNTLFAHPSVPQPAIVLPTPPMSEPVHAEPDFEILEEEPAVDLTGNLEAFSRADVAGLVGKEEAHLEPHGLAPLDTPVNNHFMYIFFRFCAERHRMFNLRNEGVPRDELTEDETMRKEHIGNIYRELDSGSLRMGDLIIPVGDQSNEEICCECTCISV